MSAHDFQPTRKLREESMPHPFNSDRPTDDPHIGIDRRKLLRGAAALAATAQRRA